MRKIDLGQAIAIFANIGVIAGIVFLAIEIRQNREIMEVQVRANTLEQRRSMGDLLFNQPEVIDLLLKDPSDLSPTEYERVRLLGMQFLLTSEANYFEAVRSGVDMERVAQRTRSVVGRETLNYGAFIAWPVYKETAEPEFVRWFEGVISADASE